MEGLLESLRRPSTSTLELSIVRTGYLTRTGVPSRKRNANRYCGWTLSEWMFILENGLSGVVHSRGLLKGTRARVPAAGLEKILSNPFSACAGRRAARAQGLDRQPAAGRAAPASFGVLYIFFCCENLKFNF